MRGSDKSFFVGQAVDLIVRNGGDFRLPYDTRAKRDPHTVANVYRIMLRQICRDYPSLPPFRHLTLARILFFYDGLRNEIRRYTKPQSE